MRSVILYVFSVLTILSPSILQAKPGFYSTHSPTTATNVKSTADAVYRYVVIDEEKLAEFDLKKPAIPEGLVLRPGTPNPPTIPEVLETLFPSEFQTCRMNGQTKCKVPFIGMGTAFIVGKKRNLLITARHNLTHDSERYFKSFTNADGSKSKMGELRDIWLGEDEQALQRHMPLHFVLLDWRGKPVFDSRNPRDYGTIEVIGDASMLDPKDVFQGGFPSDFASIRLSRAVGEKSLEFREARPQPSELLTVVGFPSPTWSRAEMEHAPDSDGISQVYSTGLAVTPATALQFYFGPGYIKDVEREARIDQTTTYVDIEVLPGYSGSPILDAEGKVVGMMQAMFNLSGVPTEMYMLYRAEIFHSEWLLKNFRKYDPSGTWLL